MYPGTRHSPEYMHSCTSNVRQYLKNLSHWRLFWKKKESTEVDGSRSEYSLRNNIARAARAMVPLLDAVQMKHILVLSLLLTRTIYFFSVVFDFVDKTLFLNSRIAVRNSRTRNAYSEIFAPRMVSPIDSRERN